MTVALVDGDIVAYRCSASAEKDPEEISYIRADRLLKDIVSSTDADEVRVFLSGKANFRKDLYPEYKANRKDMVRPKWLQKTREYLILEWSATVTDGYEADDAIGIELIGSKGTGISCSLDKDLLQLPGTHYNFVTEEFREITSVEGWRNFYQQLVLGDRADNVPGYDGKMRIKWPKFLADTRERLEKAQSCNEMYTVIDSVFKGTREELNRNARLLYIWRQENDQWQLEMHRGNSSEPKAETEQNSESTATTPGGNARSMVRTGTKRKRAGSRSLGRRTATSSPKTSRAD